MSEGDDSAREHDPTPRRLEEARRRGDVAQAPDLAAAAATAGLLLACAAAGAWILARSGDVAAAMLGEADRLAEQVFREDRPVLVGLAAAAAWPLLPLFLLPAALALAAIILQGALVAAPDRIAPRLSRINPIAAAAHRFGPEGLTDFAKNLTKLAVVSAVLTLFLSSRSERILALQRLPAGPGAVDLAGLLGQLLALFVGVSLVIGAIDLLIQRYLRLRRNRMTRQELMDEFREAEGDPHLRGMRRRRAEEIALSRSLAEVPKADVVIVNPTHYAVALRWRRESGRAPVCVAKGADFAALRIREAAVAAGVPVRSDPPTARAIYATVEVGAEIRTEHYRAIAAALRFAEDMRRRARERGW
jgi:flagellar biosynthetic protein FlhB